MKRLLIIATLCVVTYTSDSYSMARRSSRVAPTYELSEEYSCLSSQLADSNTSSECLYELPEIQSSRTALHDAFYNQDKTRLELIIRAIQSREIDIDKNAPDENGYTVLNYILVDNEDNDIMIRPYYSAIDVGFVRKPDPIQAISIKDISDAHAVRESLYFDMVQMVMALYGLEKLPRVSFNLKNQVRFISNPILEDHGCCTIS